MGKILSRPLGIEQSDGDPIPTFDFITLANMRDGIAKPVQVVGIDITENGEYEAPPGYAYSPANVNVSGGTPTLITKTITENGTYSAEDDNADGYSEVTVDVSGGADLGGLAEMVDVNTQDYQLAYMLMCMKKGQTAGGTVTYTQAFANSETKILSTGLTTIHGLLFVGTDQNLHVNEGSAQASKWVLITIDESGNYNAIGTTSQTSASVNTNQLFNITQGNNADAVPVNGALRFDGGDVYYKGRYNKNSGYQLIAPNKQYDWLAW